MDDYIVFAIRSSAIKKNDNYFISAVMNKPQQLADFIIDTEGSIIKNRYGTHNHNDEIGELTKLYLQFISQGGNLEDVKKALLKLLK